jgi:3-hydroxyethyl bacteriochlorophyllide a dehydrogenase
METRAIVFPEPLAVRIESFNLPEPGPDEILTRTVFSGVSTGTEIRVFQGRQRQTTFPLIPGYENVGEILRVGTDVENLRHGQRIFHSGSRHTGPFCQAWGAQMAHAVVKAGEAILIPEGVSSLQAVYTKTAAIALHGIKRARVQPGETVAIVGQGLIGHLAAQAAKAFGAVVIAIDPIQERLENALKAGMDHILNPNDGDVIRAVKDLTGDRLDVAVDVTGLAKTIQNTLQLLPVKPWGTPYQPSGRLLILGSYTAPICLDYDNGLFDIEPDILISRDTVQQDYVDVLALIERDLIHPETIPAHRLRPAQASEGYQALLDRKVMRVIFDWSEP